MNIKFKLKTRLNKEFLLVANKNVLFKAVHKMELLAKTYVPVDTGRLKNSIKVLPFEWGKKIYKLTDGVEYGMDVEYGCFFGNSHRIKILTRRGYKSLRNVLIGDLVLTHKNRWQKVTSKLEYDVNKRIPRYTFKTNSGKKITVTEEHPFRIKEEFGYIWKKAKDIKKEDILMGVN